MRYDYTDEGSDFDEAEDCQGKKIEPMKPSRQPFVIVPAQIHTDERLKSLDIKVYIEMTKYLSEDRYCYPHIATLASKVGKHYRSITRCLARLEEAGYIKRHNQWHKHGGQTANIFYLDLNPQSEPISQCRAKIPHPLGQKSPTPRTKESHISRFKKQDLNFKNLLSSRVRTREKCEADELRTASKQVEIPIVTPQDLELKQNILGLVKGCSWVELVRNSCTYGVRPVSQKSFNYISEQDFNKVIDFVASAAGGCRLLKFGQYLDGEIVI